MPSPLEIGVIVTVTSLETAPGANVTVALPSALVTLPPAGVIVPWPAGGESPLAVLAVGSGAVVSQELGVVVVSLPCADDVVSAGVPSLEPEDVPPALLVAPSTEPVLGHPVTLGALLPLPLVPLTAATVTPESPLGATFGSIVPEVPVLACVVAFERIVSLTVLLPPAPTTVCVIGAGVGAWIWAGAVADWISAGAVLEI
jgi:hypothetical protein